MTHRPLLAALPLLLLLACSPETYKESADREVHRMIAEKQAAVRPREEPFNLVWEPLSIEDVGVVGSVEDLRRTPPPQPIIRPLDVENDGEPAAAEPAPQADSPPAPSTSPPEESPEPPEFSETPETSETSETPETSAASAAAGDATASPAPGEAAAAAADPEPAAERGEPALRLVETMEIDGPKVTAHVLDLRDALRIAFANNREYQSQKEGVYLTGLSLSLARYQFAPRFFGLVLGDLQSDAGDASGSIASDFGWNQLFASGARLSVSIANNLFQFFTGNRGEVANTLIGASITQPLLRGFGRAIVTEPLTQAERNVIYAIRALERFRRTFVVQVATEFYRVLQARNRVSNEYRNWQSLVNGLDRARNLAQGERLALFEVDQVEQQELEAQDRYLVAVEDYESQVDRFKVTLGIAVDTRIGLDPSELDRLRLAAREPVDVNVDLAVSTAVLRRLDLMTARDASDDAQRRATVAADALQAQLDITLSADLPSGTATGGAQTPLKFDPKDGLYEAGFELDLPFDRRAERNDYAAALIAAEREQREEQLFEDNVRVTVRDAHRRLLRERSTLRIQEASVRLAAARVESTRALLDAGRVSSRDVLESQEDLINAQNAYTSALINFTLARLEFHRDTGTLRVEREGRFVEERITEVSLE